MARLIDADALERSFRDVMLPDVPTYLNVITGMIHAMPTVDAEPVRQWISVKDKLPETEKHVLVSIKTSYGKRFTTVAAHVGHHERNSESDGWSLEYELDWDEYDEENDWYWVPECWYECNFIDDNPNFIIDPIDGEVTHWMPLPEPPKEDHDAADRR